LRQSPCWMFAGRSLKNAASPKMSGRRTSQSSPLALLAGVITEKMMIKFKIEGSPEEIAAFIAHVSKANGITSFKSTEITKRDETHKWGSCLAWAELQPIEGLAADYSIYKRGGSAFTNGEQLSKRKVKAGYVYLLPAYGENGLLGHKIGKTLTPYSRRKTFGNKLYFKIEFTALIASDDYTALETKLHRHFASKRQGRSEFFDLGTADIAYLQAMMTKADKALLLKVNAALK
jgi:hypothetical protein